MASTHVEETRLKPLNTRPARGGRWVLYWMQQSQRAHGSAALEYAVQRANAARLPLVACFGLMDDYPEAHLRHYRFMLEGLRETQAALRERGVALVVRRCSPPHGVALELAGEAALVVCDRGYLRHQKKWREALSEAAPCEVVQVEADVVVPVEVASNKAEFAARTLRPKIHKQWEPYLRELAPTPLERDSLGLGLEGLALEDVDSVLQGLKLDNSVPAVHHLFRGGTREARRHLHQFLSTQLPHYEESRPRPERSCVSYVSMYLHFGQLSPVEVALAARQAKASPESRDSFLEELIVRRELAMNYAEFNPRYDQYEALPEWARRTLDKHRQDRRPHRYGPTELERARTHDPYWNAAMREMRYTGYMHNMMRMYWGKKILEWSDTPEQAYATTLALNNKYFLDGRDANSYTNVGWLFGLHDRPWGEREIFGTVRYMAASGLDRKADMKDYVAKVDRLVAEARAAGVRFAGE